MTKGIKKMPTIDEIKAKIAEATKNYTDPELTKALGGINQMLDDKKKEDDDAVAKYGKLAKDYREAVMNAPLPPIGSADEKGAADEGSKSLEDCIAEELSKGKK